MLLHETLDLFAASQILIVATQSLVAATLGLIAATQSLIAATLGLIAASAVFHHRAPFPNLFHTVFSSRILVSDYYHCDAHTSEHYKLSTC